MKYLLDTNVISELRKKRVDHNVARWFEDIESDQIVLSCITLGEIKVGILKKAKKDKQSANILENWFNNLQKIYSNQIVNIDSKVCDIWARLCIIDATNAIDSMLAAQAINNDLILVTRNIKHFNMFNIAILNPFVAQQKRE